MRAMEVRSIIVDVTHHPMPPTPHYAARFHFGLRTATWLAVLFFSSSVVGQSWSAPVEVTDARGSGGHLGR